MSSAPIVIIISRPKRPSDNLTAERIELLEVEGECTADTLRRAAEQVESE